MAQPSISQLIQKHGDKRKFSQVHTARTLAPEYTLDHFALCFLIIDSNINMKNTLLLMHCCPWKSVSRLHKIAVLFWINWLRRKPSLHPASTATIESRFQKHCWNSPRTVWRTPDIFPLYTTPEQLPAARSLQLPEEPDWTSFPPAHTRRISKNDLKYLWLSS